MKNDSRTVGNDTGRGLASADADGCDVVGLAMEAGDCCGSDGSADGDDFIGRPSESVQPSRRKATCTSKQEI